MSPITADLNVRNDLQHLSVSDIIAVQESVSLPYAVAVVNLNGDLNLGVIMRNAVLFAAERMFIFGKRRYDRRSTVGAQNYIQTHIIDCELIDHCISRDVFHTTLNEYGYTPVFIEQGGTAITDFDFKSISKPCLVFGNEGYGLPDSFMDGIRVSIAQRGVLRSLNVSSAAAIACYQCSNQLVTAW